jgi:hypothetical protein
MKPALAAALLPLVLVSSACGTASPKPVATPAATSRLQQAQANRFSAESLAHGLGAKFRMPNPRDNTTSCADFGCAQLITTDSVSIYEFKTVAKAKAFEAGSFKGTVKRVGRFALSWAGRRQGAGLPSARVRAAMVARAVRLVKVAAATA